MSDAAARRPVPLGRKLWRWLWPWRWLGVAILATWGWVLLQLAQQTSLSGAKKLEELFPWAVQKPLSTGVEWMGIYLKGKKIGYSRNHTKKLPAGYAITQRSVMHMTLFGRRQHIKLFSRVEVDRRYQLKQFSFRLDSGLSLFRATGVVKGKKLQISLLTGGAERKVSIAYKPAMLASVMRPYIAAQRPPPGQRINTWMFDPQTMSYSRALIVVERYETIVHQGKKIRALRLRQQVRGLRLLAWLDDKGRVLKEFSPTGMMLVRESAHQAPRGIQKSFDVIRATRVQLRGRLDRPTRRQLLVVRLERASLSSFPDLQGLRQRLQGRFLTIQRQPWPGPVTTWPKVPVAFAAKAAPLPANQYQSTLPQKATPRWQTPLPGTDIWRTQQHKRLLKQALQATPLIQSKHYTIQRQAHQITMGTKHRIEALQALMQWMAASITERSVVGVPSALEVLKRRVGDCNEHATLFAALARALQIPCTITSGLAYRRGSFYFHAWNECHIQGQKWVSVDPLWRQFPADVTHIAFVRGGLKDQSRLLQLLGKLQISVVK